MNVTVKIDDKLCREARHRAVDRGLSLSGWIAEVLRKELSVDESAKQGLLHSLAMEEGAEKMFEVPRDTSAARDIAFSE
jgi:hypothetical protein